MISFLASLWSVLRPSRFTFVSFLADVANKDWYIATYEHRVKTYFYMLPSFLVLFTKDFSGPGGAIGRVWLCVCVSVCRTVTFKLSDIWSRYLARWFNSTISRSSSKVKVIGKSSPSHEDNTKPSSVTKYTGRALTALFVRIVLWRDAIHPAPPLGWSWWSLSIYQIVLVRVRAFAYAGPTTWNSLHDFFKNVNLSLSTFKRHLKTFSRY